MLNYFVNEIKMFVDLYKLTTELTLEQRSHLFTELVKLIFIYHPLYNNLSQDYHTYDTLTGTLRLSLSIRYPTNLHFIFTQFTKIYSIQIKYVENENDKVKWEFPDIYENDKITKHFFVTNSISNENTVNIKNSICMFGNFFKTIKTEWFIFLKHKLFKQLYVFPKLIPSSFHTKLINEIINFNTDQKIIECEFNTEFVMDHYWISREMDSKLTIIVTESVPHLIKIYNDTSYQKMINDYKQNFILIGDNSNNGIVFINNVNDIIENIKWFTNDNLKINLTIGLTYNYMNILMGALNIINLISDLLIAYPTNDSHMSLDNNKFKRKIFVKYPYNFFPDYSISNCSLINNDAPTQNESSIKSITPIYELPPNIQKPLKFVKTNIMDYLKIDDNDKVTIYTNKNDDIKCDASWTEQYTKLVIFNNTNNRLPCGTSIDTIEQKLGEFLETQLQNIQNNKLSQDQIEKLQLLEGWSTIETNCKISVMWSQTYNKLLKWINKYDYPKQCSNNKNESLLFTFLHEQIIMMCANTIDANRHNKIIALPNWEKHYEKYVSVNEWTLNFNLLLNWVHINNKLPCYTPNMELEEFQLIKFIELHKQMHKQLSVEKINLLETIPNWTWENTNDDLVIWDSLYKCLKSWIMEHNNLPSVTLENAPVNKLTIFIDIQKQNKYLNKLTDKQIKKLELLPLWNWEGGQCNIWDLMYNKILLYCKMHSNFPNIDYTTDEEIQLAIFMDIQKKEYQIDLLNLEQITKLNKLSFWNFDNEYVCQKFIYNKINNLQCTKITQKLLAWDKTYTELIKWYELHDSPPKRNMDIEHEKILHYFIDKQKKLQKNGLLSEYKIKKLELLPNWNWISQKNANNEEWEISYNELSQWIKTNNKMPQFNVNDDVEKKIFNFCSEQIVRNLDGNLDNKKIKKLESFKCWSWTNDVLPEGKNNVITKKWTTKYEKLIQWFTTHENYPQHGTKDVDEDNLVTFIYNNRYLFNKKKLNAEQIQKLESLDNWTWYKNDGKNDEKSDR